jgi:hypothetical protein
METTVYNPQKGRLETIDVEITKENTTWFDDYETGDEIYTITDVNGDLLVGEPSTTIIIIHRRQLQIPTKNRSTQ